jgi:hypothetical protein
MILIHERLRDRLEAVLPTTKEFACSLEELAFWLNCSIDEVRYACLALRKWGVADYHMEPMTYGRGNHVVFRKMWWRCG